MEDKHDCSHSQAKRQLLQEVHVLLQRLFGVLNLQLGSEVEVQVLGQLVFGEEPVQN